MTTANNDFMPVYELVGQVMTNLGAHYEILILRFGEYEIQVSCFAGFSTTEKFYLQPRIIKAGMKKTTSTMTCTSILQSMVRH